MYQVGETVLYGVNGVCSISHIEEKKIDGNIKKYYVLKPVYNKSSTLFVPTDNQLLLGKMKKILSVQEIYDLIAAISNEELMWIDNEQERIRCYQDILKSGNRLEIMRVIKTLYEHQEKLKTTNKKFHVADEKILKSAECILHEEFAYVLDIKKEQVIPFILNYITVDEK